MLVKEGIKPWLDEDQIKPGTSWQSVLGQQIEAIKSAAVFVGDGGLGPWQDQEMQSFLNRFVSQKYAVIPVILDSAKATPDHQEELLWNDGSNIEGDAIHIRGFCRNGPPLIRCS